MNRVTECEAIWDFLSAYADGEATPEEARIVETHIAACPECARDLQFMQETAQMLAHTPEIAPPPGLREAIFAVTTRRTTWQERIRTALGLTGATHYRRLAWVGSAACALALFGAGWIALLQTGGRSCHLAMQLPTPPRFRLFEPPLEHNRSPDSPARARRLRQRVSPPPPHPPDSPTAV
jgi:anti-sigma factor RsiW